MVEWRSMPKPICGPATETGRHSRLLRLPASSSLYIGRARWRDALMRKEGAASVSSMLQTTESTRPCWYSSLHGSRAASPVLHTLLSAPDVFTAGPITDKVLCSLHSNPHHVAALMHPMCSGSACSSISTCTTPVDPYCHVVASCLTTMGAANVDSPCHGASNRPAIHHKPNATAAVPKGILAQSANAMRCESSSPLNGVSANSCSSLAKSREAGGAIEASSACPSPNLKGSTWSQTQTVQALPRGTTSEQPTHNSSHSVQCQDSAPHRSPIGAQMQAADKGMHGGYTPFQKGKDEV
eukprot:jgi/Botrbrau1/7199/Bobra.0300s0025.1